MKNVVDILLIFLFASLILVWGCKKNKEPTPTPTPIKQVPVLSTSAVSNISATTASCGGNITSEASAFSAVDRDFTNGAQSVIAKNNSLAVRAVRTF